MTKLLVADEARCLDDTELLALVERRLAIAAQLQATAHLDACLVCLELVVELVRGGFRARAQQALERELELRLDER